MHSSHTLPEKPTNQIMQARIGKIRRVKDSLSSWSSLNLFPVSFFLPQSIVVVVVYVANIINNIIINNNNNKKYINI